MKVSADFTTIPDAYAKHAPEGNLTDGVPVVSFPFYISDIAPQARYVHWEFVDDDAIPVSGFQWIHWSVANLPLDALMYDFNDSHALQIPEDFSRQLPARLHLWSAVRTLQSASGITAPSLRINSMTICLLFMPRPALCRGSVRGSGLMNCAMGCAKAVMWWILR